MSDYLISVCIPTFNRAKCLKDCLDDIVIQFKDEEVAKKVEVVILDNISKDNTEKIVDEFAQKYSNIKYHKDTKDRNIAGGQIKVGGLGTGEYIWFFSDDDKFTIDAFKTLIRALENKDYGAIFCNTSSFSANKSENIISENNFKIQQDLILKTKKDLFNFVGKHFYCYNFFFTFMSNYIVKRDVFRQGLEVIKKYKSTLAILYLNNKVINARINNSSSYKITKIDKLFYKYNYRLTLVSTTIFLNHKENDKFIYKKFENSNFIGFALMVDVIRFRNETAILSGKLLKCRMDTISGYNFFDAFIFNIFSIFNYMVSIGYSNKIIRIFKENLIIHIWAKRYFYFKAKGKLDANLEYYDLKTANHILQKYFKGTISYWLIIFPMTLFPSSVFRKCFPYVEKLRNFMRSIN